LSTINEAAANALRSLFCQKRTTAISYEPKPEMFTSKWMVKKMVYDFKANELKLRCE
jgi:hypothetical protein